MEIRKLTYFVVAAQTENFNRAAELCQVAQPVLGRQIAALEAELGFALFQRLKKRVVLTDEGRAYLDYACAALEQLQRGKLVAGALRSGEHGSVSVGCIDPLSQTLMPKALSSLQQRFPNIHVQLWFCGADEVANGVAQGIYDVGVTHLSAMQTVATKLLVIHQLYREQLHAVATTQHPLALRHRAGQPVTLADLVAQPLVLYQHGSGSGIRNVLDRVCTRRGLPLRAATETNLTESMKALVRTGVGLTFLLPTDLAAEQPDSPLVLIPIADLFEEFTFSVVYRRFGTISPTTKTVIQALLTGFASQAQEQHH